MSGSKQITVLREFRATPDVCAEALELLLKKSVSEMAAEPATERNVRSDVSITNRKEVNDVGHRPYRPSEIVVTYSRKSRNQ
jgi:hypothetical protein